MSNDRHYGSGTEKALFLLSRGTCYEPTCKAPVLKMSKSGTPRVNVQIAHIYPLGKHEARYDEGRRAGLNEFANLLLLCQSCHTEVDSDKWEKFYQAPVLFHWKKAREGDLESALLAVPPLATDEQFQELLVGAIARLRDDIIGAIDKVAGLSEETLGLVKELVAESFARPYLSEDSVASLAYSARVFDSMGDQTTLLYESARGLNRMHDPAWMLYESSRGLRRMPDYVPVLVEAARALQRVLPDNAATLADTADKLIRLPDHANILMRAAEKIDRAQPFGILDRVAQINSATQRLEQATTAAPEIAKAAQMLEDAAQAATTAIEAIPEEVTQPDWSWRSFQWGAAVCFTLVVGLLILWTFALK